MSLLAERQNRCLMNAESDIAQSHAIYGKVNCRHASVKQFSEQTLIGVAALCITAPPNNLVTATRKLRPSQDSSPSSGQAPDITFLAEACPDPLKTADLLHAVSTSRSQQCGSAFQPGK